MANKIINGTVNGLTGYAAAITIDPANDYLLLQQGGVYKSINRNTYLGITGSPVGTSDTQTVTNKTLDNTNGVTLKTNKFTLQDLTDTTKQGIFSLAGITTGTTRTYTLPNASVTLASLTGTETLVNKTITSPVISGGTIDNATITVDSISGHTTSTIVSVGGVQLNNGVIGTSNAVVTASVADGAITPAKLLAGAGTGWGWQTFTPSWTNLTVGNGTTVASYTQIGKLVKGFVLFTLGSSSAVGTAPSITPPVAANAAYNNGSVNFPLGTGWLNAAGSGNLGFFYFAGSNTIMRAGYSVANVLTQIDATHPGTWATGNILYLDFEYQAA